MAVTTGRPEALPPQPPRPRRRAKPTPPPLWWRARRALLAMALIAAVAPLISYVGAITARSDSTFGIRSVEWLRDHGARGLVNQIENWYYSLTAPSKGGPQLHSLPVVGYAAAGASTRGRVGSHRYYRPPPIRPVLSPALPGEGVWRTARPSEGLNAPVLITTYRPLADYPRVVAGVAWIDPHRAVVALYPGLQEPSVAMADRGPEEVPLASRNRLLATFNSGFKLADAGGGFALNGHTYAPLQPGIATLVRYRSGRMDIVAWQGGPRVSSTVDFARQNLPLIVNHGRLNPNLSDGPEWGATLGNAILVWRSGIGVDRHGNLIYVAANDLTVATLAQILKHAGAVRAMELDINNYWESFITYRHPGAVEPTNLLPEMPRSSERYLTQDDRDFFAVYSRPHAASLLPTVLTSRSARHALRSVHASRTLPPALTNGGPSGLSG
jgi:Phosphodiester glycosidase